MTRSPIWIAAYVAAWYRLRGLRIFGDPTGTTVDIGSPMPPTDIARRCALEADECEAAYVESFGPLDDEPEDGRQTKD